MKAVPIQRLLQMQPTNAAFFSLFLKDTVLLPLAALNSPRFAHPKKKKEKKKKTKTWRRHVTEISRLNVSIGFFYSFELPTPDMLNFKLKTSKCQLKYVTLVMLSMMPLEVKP